MKDESRNLGVTKLIFRCAARPNGFFQKVKQKYHNPENGYLNISEIRLTYFLISVFIS